MLKDIAPGYRIRSLSKEEKAAAHKLSHDVRELHDHEAALLRAYQRHLVHLGQRLRDSAPTTTNSSSNGSAVTVQSVRLSQTAMAALRCMGELLQALPHFNFRTNLVNAVVRAMCHSDAELRAVAVKCVSGLFSRLSATQNGEAAKDAVSCLHTMTKNRMRQLRPEVRVLSQ